jgi:hypothetical protein
MANKMTSKFTVPRFITNTARYTNTAHGDTRSEAPLKRPDPRLTYLAGFSNDRASAPVLRVCPHCARFVLASSRRRPATRPAGACLVRRDHDILFFSFTAPSPLNHSIQPRQEDASAPPLARRAPPYRESPLHNSPLIRPPPSPSCSPAFTLHRSHARITAVEAPPTRREEEAAGMGLLSNWVERSEIRPGDHIYTWRAVYAYSHHGTPLDPLLCGPDCAAAGAVNSHWCSTGGATQFVDLTGILGSSPGSMRTHLRPAVGIPTTIICSPLVG